MGNPTQKRADDGRWTIGSGWQELTLEDGRVVTIEHSVHAQEIKAEEDRPQSSEEMA